MDKKVVAGGAIIFFVAGIFILAVMKGCDDDASRRHRFPQMSQPLAPPPSSAAPTSVLPGGTPTEHPIDARGPATPDSSMAPTPMSGTMSGEPHNPAAIHDPGQVDPGGVGAAGGGADPG